MTNENDNVDINNDVPTRTIEEVAKQQQKKIEKELKEQKQKAKEKASAEAKLQKQNKPNMRSKAFQKFLCAQVVLQMAETGRMMDANAQEAWALNRYNMLAQDFVTKSIYGSVSGDLFAVMTEYHASEFTFSQMMKGKGDELLTGKNIITRGKAARLEIENFIADEATREEIKKNAKMMRHATGEELSDSGDDDSHHPNEEAFTFTNDSGDPDGGIFLERVAEHLAKLEGKKEQVRKILKQEEKRDHKQIISSPHQWSSQRMTLGCCLLSTS